MKARTNWLIAGERNTSYFHLSTIVRRSANKISCVKLENGEWIYDLDQIKHYFREGFLKFYTTESLLSTKDMTLEMACCRLLAHKAVGLASIPLNAEILVALKSMTPYKALGPDGLHAGFFQRHWNCVGDSVKDEVRNIFISCEMSAFLNQTLIAFIPKQKGLETISHFRPISLCNTVYKLVTKILVQRLRPHMPNLISPCQTAFVAGRRGSDNIIIAQEIIYFLNKHKGKEEFMIVKIDLEKSYDRLEWCFIRKVLTCFGFPPNIIKLIMSCISSSSTSLLFNGEKLPPFAPSRGIRQGDPLSPFIFLLCMEYLNTQIEDLCDSKQWMRVKASSRGPGFSHIFFCRRSIVVCKSKY